MGNLKSCFSQYVAWKTVEMYMTLLSLHHFFFLNSTRKKKKKREKSWIQWMSFYQLNFDVSIWPCIVCIKKRSPPPKKKKKSSLLCTCYTQQEYNRLGNDKPDKHLHIFTVSKCIHYNGISVVVVSLSKEKCSNWIHSIFSSSSFVWQLKMESKTSLQKITISL